MGKLAEQVNNLEFIRGIRILISSPGKMAAIAAIDILFFLTAFILRKFAESLDINPTAVSTSLIAGVLLLSVLYYAVLLLGYSFFKLCVLGLVKSAAEKSVFEFGKLGKFYLLNLGIFSAILTVSILVGSVLASAKESFAIWVIGIAGVPYMITVYIFMNIAHSAFAQRYSIKESFKEGLRHIKNLRAYTGIIIPSIILAAVLSLPYSFLYARTSLAAGAVLLGVFEGLAYILFFINRIGFYIASKTTTKVSGM